jgi:hypothetical protein
VCSLFVTPTGLADGFGPKRKPYGANADSPLDIVGPRFRIVIDPD